MRKSLLLFVGLFLLSSSAHATDYVVGPSDDLWATMQGLVAGDTLTVTGGTFNTPGYVMLDWQGSAEAPITIRASEGTLIVGDPSQNAMNITGQHFSLSGLEITEGSHGLRLYNVHDALLDNLHIHHTGEVALSANIGDHEYYNITFRNLHLHNTGGHGEGMYLGCNDGACSFHDNVIEDCWIHDTNQGVSQGDGIEIKQGSYGNIIRNNIIHDTQYPCIIVYGTAGESQNQIYGNAMWNCGDSGIQAAADAIIENNLIYNAVNGINSHTHQGAVPSNMIIRNNTIVGSSDRCIRASDWSSASIELRNNAIYCEGGTAMGINPADQITASGNVVLGNVSGLSEGYTTGRSASQDFVDAASRNLFPSADSALLGAATEPQAILDFDGVSRALPGTVGAYQWEACRAAGIGLVSGYKEVVPCEGAVEEAVQDIADLPPMEPIEDEQVENIAEDQDLLEGLDELDSSSTLEGQDLSSSPDNQDLSTSPDNQELAEMSTNASDEGCGCQLKPQDSDKSSALGLSMLGLLALGFVRKRKSAAE